VKLSATQENLSKALAIVGRAVSSRSSLPVLSNVLLSTDSNRLKISATNLEIGITYWIGCKSEEEGAVTVPSRLFTEFITSLPSGNIVLSSDDTHLEISTPHYKSQINGIASDEFPLIPDIKSKAALTISAELFRDALAQVVIAASLDEARPVLAGVYMYVESDQLILVATDSYRLAEKRIRIAASDASSDLSVIVPVRTMQELVRILTDGSSDLQVFMSDNQVLFAVDDIELTSRLIDGQFPNYKQIIPATLETTFEIGTTEFGRIAKVASLFARENSGSMRLAIQAEGQVEIITTASQIGENTSSAECRVDGDDAEVSLNSKFLSDALSVMRSPSISFGLSGKLSACVLRPVGKGIDTEDYLHLIMPLRT
jgi:DNA polymerase III subunit beta